MDELIDQAAFAALQDTAGPEFVGELIDAFLEEAPTMLADLREARGANDGERFRRAAHSLKSNATTFGALALGGLARELELDGLSADAGVDAARLAALETSYEAVRAALVALRDG
jgi:HPt (histidine-containing phosphotransfer) domain-containing protein